jgi:hypothetical protein
MAHTVLIEHQYIIGLMSELQPADNLNNYRGYGSLLNLPDDLSEEQKT